MEPDRQELEDKRRELGETEEPVEDELAEAFRSTLTEGAERLSRTWRALLITGLFGGIDVGLGIMAMLAVKEATGSDLLAGMAFGIGLFALRLAHSELFTEDFLVPIQAVVAKHGTWMQLGRLWSATLVTNLAGGWLFTWLIAVSFPDLGSTLLETAQGYLEGGLSLETAGLALLAGSTITLTTRMAQGTQNDVVTGFISLISGFLVVGTGMLHGALNSIVLFAAMHMDAPISYGEWAVWALWVIPLNMVGGLVIITVPRLFRTLELIQEERAKQGRKQAEEHRAI